LSATGRQRLKKSQKSANNYSGLTAGVRHRSPAIG
jgi:hypothetical protein